MNNKPSTKVRRRLNTAAKSGNGIGYKCGQLNTNKRRLRPCRGVLTPMELRHGKDNPKVQLYKDIQRGVIKA